MKRYPKVGFAILGAGMIAEYHAQAIAANAQNGARLVAVGHYDPQRFAEIELRFGVPCRSEDELLSDPQVDVLCICTPSGQHAGQTIAAARSGKHVLVEKPIATRLEDADAMIAVCQENHVTLGVAFQSRTKPVFQRIQAAIQGGELGELTLGLVNLPYYRAQSYYEQADWRGTWALDGGGVLMNQGIHQVDLLAWYMGDPIAVSAHALTLHRQIEVEDTLCASLRFANGALAGINATTTAAPGFPPRLEIYGTRGGVQMEGDIVMRWWSQDGHGETESTSAQPSSAGAGADPRGISVAGHIALVSDFTEALRDERPPLVDGVEGRRSLAIVESIYQAAGRILLNG
jgi:UDP-N-acetyl-2-amino-2-deoxyglucuronate dehydrogenase